MLHFESNRKKTGKGRLGRKNYRKTGKRPQILIPRYEGFSIRNIQYMVRFVREYPDISIVQQLVAQIPWGHNVVLLEKLKDSDSRAWYAQKTIENGWSRSVLLHWIEGNLHQRQGKSLTNFKQTLPAPQSDLARQTLKAPYCFDFLTLREEFDEREIEDGLIEHIQKFLIELGTGFAFVGRQHKLTVDRKDFFLDLLFYHLKLRCFVIVELKASTFPLLTT